MFQFRRQEEHRWGRREGVFLQGSEQTEGHRRALDGGQSPRECQPPPPLPGGAPRQTGRCPGPFSGGSLPPEDPPRPQPVLGNAVQLGLHGRSLLPLHRQLRRVHQLQAHGQSQPTASGEIFYFASLLIIEKKPTRKANK